MKIILFGPQGAGKGTYARMLVKEFNLEYIESGRLLREIKEQNTILGKKVKSLVDKGQLVPDELIGDIIRSKFHELENKDFVLDGFPRNLTQAKILDSILAEKHTKVDHVIEITLPEEETIRRLTARRTCSNCGQIYNLLIKNLTPKKEEICDICGKKLQIRKDDNPDAIKKRLEIYHKETEPISKYYEEQGILNIVDGVGLVDEVFNRILKIIKAE